MEAKRRRRFCTLNVFEVGEHIEVVESDTGELPVCPRCNAIEFVEAVVIPRCKNPLHHADKPEIPASPELEDKEVQQEPIGFLSRADLDRQRAQRGAAAEGEVV